LKPFLDAYDGDSDLEYDEPSTPAVGKRTPASSAKRTPSTANISSNADGETLKKKKNKNTKTRNPTPTPTPPISEQEEESEVEEPVRSQI
jgi:hypothetical protein